MGPARITGRSAFDLIYFRHLESDRSLNVNASIRISVPVNRLQPYFTTSYLRTRERPTVEIDARSQRQEGAATVGAELRISGVTTAEFFAKRSTVEFAPSAAFLDTSLKETFDRTITDLGASLRHRLTPLTTLTIAAEATDERFVFAPVRKRASA